MGRVHNPVRVAEILKRANPVLREADLRVGQFIMNAVAFAGMDGPYYLEDDKLADRLEAYLAELQGKIQQ